MIDPTKEIENIHLCRFCKAWSYSEKTITEHLKKCEAKNRIDERELKYKNEPWIK